MSSTSGPGPAAGWWIVRNPSAGGGREVAARLRRALLDHRVDAEVVVSQSAGHVADLVAEGRSRGLARFAAVGGDGTAHLVLNGLMAHPWPQPPTLAIIPAGSGSDFIRTFALPRTVEGGVALLGGGQVYRCDIGKVEGRFGERWFLNAANVGVVAAAAARAGRLPAPLGALRYGAAFWLSLAGFRPADVVVDLGGRRIEQRALAVVVANGQFFGGGLNVAPQASLIDGILDVEVFAGPRWLAFEVMPRVIGGHHLRHRAVKRGRASALTITVPDDWPVEADGELLGQGPVRITAHPGAIDFVI
ncbi:MAG: YegS/Rv2252/BmrU family lipid kinase [Acidimicrobiia bacterium]|nr:YegS/Rv2252/BmrU family lipid kinase [Acidimicrobiia bacterium]